MNLAVFMACLLAALLATASAAAPNPVPDPRAVVASADGSARFTVLCPALIRCEHTMAPRHAHDDRATSVVVNRRTAVPEFTASRPNATALVITTKALRLTYNAPAPPSALDRSRDGQCGCTATECKTSEWSNTSWAVHNGTQGGDGKRTRSCPNGLLNQTLSECFCACMKDMDCEVRLQLVVDVLVLVVLVVLVVMVVLLVLLLVLLVLVLLLMLMLLLLTLFPVFRRSPTRRRASPWPRAAGCSPTSARPCRWVTTAASSLVF